VIIVLSDHGYSFGEHRWEGKRCPYEACIRIPFVVHAPRGDVTPTDEPISIVDVAPTILDLVGIAPPAKLDGTTFAGRLGLPGAGSGGAAVFLEWAGDRQVPAWEAVRTADLKLIRYGDGTEELYDLGGVLGSPDPYEATNRVDDRTYAGILAELRRLLGRHPGRR
jgi:N-acetylglucosamine-6-sulfatase